MAYVGEQIRLLREEHQVQLRAHRDYIGQLQDQVDILSHALNNVNNSVAVARNLADDTMLGDKLDELLIHINAGLTVSMNRLVERYGFMPQGIVELSQMVLHHAAASATPAETVRDIIEGDDVWTFDDTVGDYVRPYRRRRSRR